MKDQKYSVNSADYAAGDYGHPDHWSELEFQHPRRGRVAGKGFLGAALGLTGMELSLNSLGPFESSPFLHAHQKNEELYLFLSGRGQMLLDERSIEVRAGTAVRVSPSVMRAMRNTGSEPLVVVVIQAQAGSLEQATVKDGIVGQNPVVWPS